MREVGAPAVRAARRGPERRAPLVVPAAADVRAAEPCADPGVDPGVEVV